MNARRHKRVKKTIAFYQTNFGFHAPLNVLIDGTFCRAALDAKVNIKEQIPKYLGVDVNIVTTQCIIMEVENLSKTLNKLRGAWLIVKQFKVHQCGHRTKLQSASRCIKSLLEEKNPNRYVVATMDQDLRSYIHTSVMGAPVLYLHGQTPTIEKPPQLYEEFLKSSDKTTTSHEFQSLKQLKTKVLGQQENQLRKRKKRSHNPNPLSCLKSKKRKINTSGPNPVSRKRRRKENKEKDIYSAIKKVFATDTAK